MSATLAHPDERALWLITAVKISFLMVIAPQKVKRETCLLRQSIMLQEGVDKRESYGTVSTDRIHYRGSDALKLVCASLKHSDHLGERFLGRRALLGSRRNFVVAQGAEDVVEAEAPGSEARRSDDVFRRHQRDYETCDGTSASVAYWKDRRAHGGLEHSLSEIRRKKLAIRVARRRFL